MAKLAQALAALAIVAACSPAPQQMTQEQLVERGAYIVNGIGGCNDCHTPMTPQGPDMARSLHGARLIFAPTIDMPWAPVAPPLAGGRPSMSDEEFAAFLQTGLRPDGSRAVPPMPQFRLNEADARAVVAYINTLPPRPENAEQN